MFPAEASLPEQIQTEADTKTDHVFHEIRDLKIPDAQKELGRLDPKRKQRTKDEQHPKRLLQGRTPESSDWKKEQKIQR